MSLHSFENQEKVLLALLKHIPFDGWSFKALETAVLEAGFERDDAHRLFEGSPRVALDFFFKWTDLQMEKKLQGLDLTALKIRERIARAILLRFEILAPYKEAVHKTLAYLAYPPNSLYGIKYLYQTVNSIWYAIGDKATDFSFYTKRASLAAVYSTTLLRWLKDQAEDNEPTRKFLENRIDNVMLIPKLKAQAKKIFRGLR